MLDPFLDDFNLLKPRIKFTEEILEQTMTFLDVTVHMGPRFETMGILDTDIYYKPTNNFLYLYGSSHHPPQGF